MTESQGAQGSSIWDRLRRRKVVQWGIAYAAGAWGLLQGLEYVTSTFDWPRQIQQLTTIGLLIGLPVALVLAWYHGDKGQQRVSRIELTIVTLLLLLGGGLFWRYQHVIEQAPNTAETPGLSIAATPPTPDDFGPSIAVLPFDNRSRLEDDAFFVDGIHDDILTQLSKISALKVISRTSVEQFRGTRLPVKEIAQQLGVKSILEGGVQRGGDRVRINVQLIDAASDAHLWAETYDRELTAENIFAIQSEVAQAIAAALRTALTESEKARVDAVPTQNLQAWEAYQLGRQRMAKRTSEALEAAERYFREAIDLDSAFALAYVGLSDALALQASYSAKPWEATLAAADQAVSRALELDPNLAEAWASKGNIAISRGRPDEAETLLRHAIELNPNYAPAHHWLSMSLRRTGRLHEELQHAQRAVELDPLSSIAQVNLGDTLEGMGRHDDAAARFRKAVEIDSRSSVAYRALAELDAYARNQMADALVLQERAVALDPGSPELQLYLFGILLELGDESRAMQVASSMAERWPDNDVANLAAAVMAELNGTPAAAERYAGKALAEFPKGLWSLRILRDGDLRRGDPTRARTRYASAFPELFRSPSPDLDGTNSNAAIDLALVLQATGESERASALLDAAERAIRLRPRLSDSGFGVADVQIHALRGDKAKALVALREAEKAGWRGPLWRYYRDVDPNLASIRDEPEFKAVFADIERDMDRQRAELAKRPKDAPLDLGPSR